MFCSVAPYIIMTMYDSLSKLTSTDVYRYCRSLLSPELINITHALPEFISVRDGAFYLHGFDDVLMRSFIDCL